jgi:hypothetical protein
MPSQGKGTPPKKIDLESLARGYTELSIRRLGGYISDPKSEPMVAIRAIELMLDRGWGAVKKKDGDENSHITITIRNLMDEIVAQKLIGKTIEHDEET